MTLARENDRPRGLQQIESGMKGIHERIEYIIDNRVGNGEFWDPRREIRSEIQSALVMIAGKAIDWEELISSGERVGQKVKEEIDKAQRDWLNDFLSDANNGAQ